MRIVMYPSSIGRAGNPFIEILVTGLRSVGVKVTPLAAAGIWIPSVLHIHWLEQVFWGRVGSRIPAVARLWAWHLVRVARKVRQRGGRVVWTVHNLRPHEPPQGARGEIWTRLLKEFVPLVTDAVLMSDSPREAILTSYPELAGARVHVIPHPHYREFFDRIAPPKARTRAPDRVPVLAMVGGMRPYKGVVELVEELKRHPDARFRLVLAGGGNPDYSRAIDQAIGDDPRFEHTSRRLSHCEIADILRDCDLAVFNFLSILNSGSVLTALSLDTPVVCPDEPVLKELAAQVGSDWVRCFPRPLDSKWLLAQLAASSSLTGQTASLDAFSPSAVVKAHCEVYEDR